MRTNAIVVEFSRSPLPSSTFSNGGGTGSGAAATVAGFAAETGATVLAFATMPFSHEGERRMRQANEAAVKIGQKCHGLVAATRGVLGEHLMDLDDGQARTHAQRQLVQGTPRGAVVDARLQHRVGRDLVDVLRIAHAPMQARALLPQEPDAVDVLIAPAEAYALAAAKTPLLADIAQKLRCRRRRVTQRAHLGKENFLVVESQRQ